MKIKFSNLSILIVFLSALTIDLSLQNWNKQKRIIEHDVHGYYGYLPMVFIYDDVRLEKSDYRMGDDYYYFWISHVTDDGGKLVKSTVGLSYLYSPFFFMAHGVALLSEDYPADGFSAPYKAFLLIGSLVFLIIGLNYVRKLLLEFGFSDKIIGLTIFILGLGTNLLAYSSQSATMPHVYNFALFAMFVYYTIKWHQNRTFKNIFILGILLGLISLIRPTNILIALFFILYDVFSWNDFKKKLLLFKDCFFQLIIVLPIVFVIWVPQFLYWKTITGHYIYYSYTEEGFYWLDPKIIEGLFSFRKGWLIYTPIMTFSLLGFFFLKGVLEKVKTAILVFTVVNIYIIFSWWCWWYGGTFGQRSMIDSYAMLSLPLAAFLQKTILHKIFKYIASALALFFIWLNIFQTYQFEFECLHYDSMTMELYFKQFGIMHKKIDFYEYLDWADYEGAKYRGKKRIVESNHPEIISSQKVNIKAFNGKFLCTEWDRFIVADKDEANTWEEFTIQEYEEGYLSIVSYDGKILSSNIGSEKVLDATRDTVNEWEKFYMEKNDDGFVSFKTSTGNYLSVRESDSRVIVCSDNFGEKTKFILVPL